MPEGVCSQYLAHDFHITEVTNHDDDDWQITGDTLAPERSLTFRVTAESRWRWTKLALWKNNEAGELLKGLHIGTANVQTACLQLGMGPRGLKSTRASVKLRVTARQGKNCFARFCHHHNERELKSLVRQKRDTPTQTKDRIEHEADTV